MSKEITISQFRQAQDYMQKLENDGVCANDATYQDLQNVVRKYKYQILNKHILDAHLWMAEEGLIE